MVGIYKLIDNAAFDDILKRMSTRECACAGHFWK
jgi:hypothetical protein